MGSWVGGVCGIRVIVEGDPVPFCGKPRIALLSAWHHDDMTSDAKLITCEACCKVVLYASVETARIMLATLKDIDDGKS